MPKINLTINRGVDGKFKKLTDMVEGYRDEYLGLAAQTVIFASPVDTGTYITSHNIGTSEVPRVNSSAGKPRKQPYGPFAQEGLNNLYADIAALPEGVNQVVMSNGAEHATQVEDEHGYAPYNTVAREHGNNSRQAAARVRGGR